MTKPIRIQINGDLILQPSTNSSYDYYLDFSPRKEKEQKVGTEIKNKNEGQNDWRKEYHFGNENQLNVHDIFSSLLNIPNSKIEKKENLSPEDKKSKGQVDWQEIATMIIELYSFNAQKSYSSMELFQFFWEEVYFKDEDLIFDQVEVLQAVNQALDYLICEKFIQAAGNKFYLAKAENLFPGNKMASKQAVRVARS